jgi:protoheme IX farnesyltransferase
MAERVGLAPLMNAPLSEPEPVTPGPVTASPASGPWLRDLLALAKPRITLTVVLTALGGFWIARRYPGVGPETRGNLWPMLLGTALVVSGANALNMYLERDTDALMHRTRRRPLPAGRLRPEVALAFGLLLSAASLPLLTFGVNALTGLLGSIALVSYVLVYTPLKRRTTAALLIGAVPGAIPPLLGWTAGTGRLDWPGLALFGVLFVWQVPHFLAIALFQKEDYARAGLKILPVEKGERATRVHMVAYLPPLIALTFVLCPLAGPVYLGLAVLTGLAFSALVIAGFRASSGARWARQVFAASILYLVILLGALMVGA